tara:strand:- start:13 stop:210 length:198 start_codon:yes stop_codon:yes gene_type:complete
MNLRDIARTAWLEKSKTTEDTDECWQAAVEAVLAVAGGKVKFYAGSLVKDLVVDMADPKRDQYER